MKLFLNGNYNASPCQDCVYVLNKLKKDGHEIHIFSFRTNSKEHEDWISATQSMIDYLNKFKIPYDKIVAEKPYYDIIIDDRALGIPIKNNMVDWTSLRTLI
jgi:hypothetical protein